MEQKKNRLYMPAEWHRQQMVQLTWPHENTDWNYMLAEVEACFVELAKAISAREQLLIVAPDTKKVNDMLGMAGAKMSNITMFECETNDTWARDHAFITILGDNVPHYVDFCFNGWGRKFEASLDNAINGKLYDAGIVKGEYE
ncbi:MAG: agmatine deiminase family protein, partial [Bacteroidaceae bacterium]|nr:agmatine deiminase family protein [Bacteroidaceae bacterium]